MSLAERLNAAKPAKKPSLAEWLISLTPHDRQLMEQAGRTWTVHALEMFIRSEDVSVSDVSIVKWKQTLGE